MSLTLFIAWVKHVTQLDSFKKTISDLEHYEPIYGRYLRDEAQSEAAKATRSGGVIPWMDSEWPF